MREGSRSRSGLVVFLFCLLEMVVLLEVLELVELLTGATGPSRLRVVVVAMSHLGLLRLLGHGLPHGNSQGLLFTYGLPVS